MTWIFDRKIIYHTRKKKISGPIETWNSILKYFICPDTNITNSIPYWSQRDQFCPLRPKLGSRKYCQNVTKWSEAITYPGGAPIKTFDFFYLKNLIGSFDFPKILLSPLARFAPGLQRPLVHFCVHGCLLLCCMYLQRMLPLCFVFFFVLLRLFFGLRLRN